MNHSDSSRFMLPPDPRPEVQASATDSFIHQATPALIAFWRIVARHRFLILAAVALATALGVLAALMMTPIYQASATLLIEATKTKVVSIEEVYPGLSSDRDHVRTQTQFLRSREVGLRVIRDLDLTNHPRFREIAQAARAAAGNSAAASDPANAPALRASPSGTADKPGAPLPASDLRALKGERYVLTDPGEEAVLRELADGLHIEAVRQSQLVLVSYESPDPVLAARIANRVAEAFIQAEMDMRMRMTISANGWLAERVAELKQNLDVSERALADAREKANLIERQGGTAGGAGGQVSDITQRLVDARVRRAQALQVYNQVKPGVAGRENAPPVASNPGVLRARGAVADAQSRFNSVAASFGPSHPTYRTAEADVRAAQTALAREIDGVINSINKDYQLAVSTEQALQNTLDQTMRAAQRDNRKEAEVAILEQDVASNRQLYTTFLSRLKETSASTDVQTPTARIVDAAVAPLRPVKPRKTLTVLSFALLGLVAGLVAAVLRSETDRSVRSIESFEKTLGLPVIATLPQLTRAQARTRGLLVASEPEAFFSEMMRMGAASVHFSVLDGTIRSIAITSAVASEGKSTVASNLALALSKTRRVLLIDADLYRPSVHRLLGLSSSHVGLAQALMGDIEITEAIREVPGTRLRVVTAGRVKGKAFNVATPNHLQQMVQMMEDAFDVVIVDAPPLEVVSDGMMIAAACSRTILVTRSGATPVSLVQKTLRRLRRIKAQPLGIVVNGHDFKTAERFYGEASGYKSYELYAKGGSDDAPAPRRSAAASRPAGSPAGPASVSSPGATAAGATAAGGAPTGPSAAGRQ
ncbi:MAG: GumC family protein [Lautropia sp.]